MYKLATVLSVCYCVSLMGGLAHAGGKIEQEQYQGQWQQQHQGQSQSADNAGNNLTTSTTVPHQAPAFGVYASGPCSGFSFAVSTVLGGGGIGTVDDECSKREAVRTFLALGDMRTALHIAKSLKAYRDMHPGDPKSEPTPHTAVPTAAEMHEWGQ